jgi:hypothetical protein
MSSPNKKQKTTTEGPGDFKSLIPSGIVVMALERTLPGWYLRRNSRSGNRNYVKEKPEDVTFASQLVPYLNSDRDQFKDYTPITDGEVRALIHRSKATEKALLLICKDITFLDYFLREGDIDEARRIPNTIKLLRSSKSKERIEEIVSSEGDIDCENQLLEVYCTSSIESVYVVQGEDDNTFHINFIGGIEKKYKLDFFGGEVAKRLFFRILGWSGDFELEKLDWDIDWSPSMKKKKGTKKYIYGDLVESEESASEEEEEKEEEED